MEYTRNELLAQKIGRAVSHGRLENSQPCWKENRPRCWTCKAIISPETLAPFCSLDCEREYNKIGF